MSLDKKLARAARLQKPHKIDPDEAAELKADAVKVLDSLKAAVDGGCTLEEGVQLAMDLSKIAMHFIAALKD